ncbi:hypothetical protein F5Y16DRAFT_391132 [Xylariaceae sp. FL0255]|nr:hypothetical protein F5Y16DRAFT_391132 [Xylariaceae sp. FL0255]
MRFLSHIIAGFSSVAIVRAAINAAAVRTQTPYGCKANGGVLVNFADDLSVMYAELPDLFLASGPFSPAHDYSFMDCAASVEFNEADFGNGGSQHRFAIANATWSNNNLTLPKASDLNILQAKVDLNIEVNNETYPARYPVAIDRYTSNLVSINADPGVGMDDAYDGPFTYTAKNPNPVFTPCFIGRTSHILKFDYKIYAQTVHQGMSSAGWTVDFGLNYQNCEWTPASDNWGQVRIKDWETYTIRDASPNSTNSTGPVTPGCTKRGASRGLY